MSNPAVEFAAIGEVVKTSTPLNAIVNVAAVAAELVTTIFVTTVVVEDGTVYSVVLDVAAAPLKRALVVVAISYYPFDYLSLSDYYDYDS